MTGQEGDSHWPRKQAAVSLQEAGEGEASRLHSLVLPKSVETVSGQVWEYAAPSPQEFQRRWNDSLLHWVP